MQPCGLGIRLPAAAVLVDIPEGTLRMAVRRGNLLGQHVSRGNNGWVIDFVDLWRFRGRYRPTAEQRFWKKVSKNGPMCERLKSRCWIWTGSTMKAGRGFRYGNFLVAGREKRLAHRYSYELHNGPIPHSHMIDHRCHTPLCVNPHHLRIATPKQNAENHSGPQSNSTTGIRGVYWSAQCNKWFAKVVHNRRQYHVGYFTDLAAAEAAVITKRNELFTRNDIDREAV